VTAEEPLDHRSLAVSLFNRTWELLDQETRSHQDRAEMLTAAFASRHHWREVGEPRNFAISDWQISRVAAVLGYPDLAEEYGQRSLDVASRARLGPFHEGFAHEALARAARLAGNRELKAKHLDIAYDMLGQIEETGERDALATDLDELKG
jgi:putative alpha-1,2-mannosidase